MNTHKILNLRIEDYFSLVVGLIADDLKIHKHLHYLALSGVDTAPLRLQIHEGVFTLTGMEKWQVTEELEEWYYKQAERSFSMDLVHEHKALLELSAEILNGIMQYAKQTPERYGSEVVTLPHEHSDR